MSRIILGGRFSDAFGPNSEVSWPERGLTIKVFSAHQYDWWVGVAIVDGQMDLYVGLVAETDGTVNLADHLPFLTLLRDAEVARILWQAGRPNDVEQAVTAWWQLSDAVLDLLRRPAIVQRLMMLDAANGGVISRSLLEELVNRPEGTQLAWQWLAGHVDLEEPIDPPRAPTESPETGTPKKWILVAPPVIPRW